MRGASGNTIICGISNKVGLCPEDIYGDVQGFRIILASTDAFADFSELNSVS